MLKKLFITCLVFLLITTSAQSTHLMGGDITWECQANGTFKFKLRLYRDCNGVAGPTTASLTVYSHPFISNIPLSLLTTIDVSPPGCMACYDPGVSPGRMQEFIFESADVNLGTTSPPVQGWMFSYCSFARNFIISNLINPGSQSLFLRSVMYPYKNQPAFPCFDSSPFFVEKPASVMCTRFPTSLVNLAEDKDLDSLVYDWAVPLSTGSNCASPYAPINFVPPYLYNSPLPQSSHNTDNVAAVLTSYSGEISYTSFTSGAYVIVVKATAYKCGVKVAEIYRDKQLILLACPLDTTIQTTPFNEPPDLNAPFMNPVTGLYDLYTDTVNAGDIVQFSLSTSDMNLNPDVTSQIITIIAAGSQFGAGFTDPNAGCALPPCATLFPAPPLSAPFGSVITFNWVTECSHLQIDSLCGAAPKAYNFVIKAADNNCPANGLSNAVITIVVEPAPPCVPVGINEDYSLISGLSVNTTANEQLEVKMNLTQSSHLEISIIDLHGRELLHRSEYGYQGVNTWTLPVSSLKSGIYFIQVRNSRGLTSKKFLVLI